ncbi:MAG: electron transfer flavoprotein subunit beta/FixA family protein, partial [Candidatus Bathyarchaeota archaeon]|nr:electron transfer flavoprotein subunit beta/FixA family protein [Candidatus Bathyarchaeota archaeon]
IVDLNELKIDLSTRQPRTEGVKRRVSDVDKRALEAAIRLKERHGGDVVSLSLGGERTRTAMLEALAMGADAAYIINDEALAGVDSLATSKVLKAAMDRVGDYDLVLCGEMTLDSLSAQVGPRLAELLDLPQVTYAKHLELVDGRLRAVKELEDVDEVVEVGLPSVVSVLREINEPRIPSLINIMKAKRKPVEEWNAATLGLSADEVRAGSSVEVIEVIAPLVERKRVVIEAETVEEAAKKLAEAILSEGVLEV